MKVRLTDYRLGIVVGALFAFGFQNAFEGTEVLVFDGLLISWNTRYAISALALGVLLMGLSVFIHQWLGALQELREAKTAPESEESTSEDVRGDGGEVVGAEDADDEKSRIEVNINHGPGDHNLGDYHGHVHLAKAGAVWYVVSCDGKQLSDGYHSIEVHDLTSFEGTVGARKETFEVPANE